MRHYGQGRVFRPRGSKKWWIEYWHDGDRVRQSSDSYIKQDAKDLLDMKKGEIASGVAVRPGARHITLADLLQRVEKDYEKKKSKPPLKRVRAYFKPETKVLDLTRDVLQGYRDAREEEGAKDQTINNELAVIGRGFELLHESGKLPHRPSVPYVEPDNARTGFFTDAEVHDVLEHLPRYLRPFVEAAYITGWRRSELVNLTWDRVDWEAGELRLEKGTTKNGAARIFPFAFHPRLAALLAEQGDRASAVQLERDVIVSNVFFHDDGRRMRGWYYDAWRTACEKAGVPGRIVHDLRRSAVRNLVRAGVNESVAMLVSGHKTRDVFDRYNITSNDDVKAAIAKLAAFHARPQVEPGAGRVLAMSGAGRRS